MIKLLWCISVPSYVFHRTIYIWGTRYFSLQINVNQKNISILINCIMTDWWIDGKLDNEMEKRRRERKGWKQKEHGKEMTHWYEGDMSNTWEMRGVFSRLKKEEWLYRPRINDRINVESEWQTHPVEPNRQDKCWHRDKLKRYVSSHFDFQFALTCRSKCSHLVPQKLGPIVAKMTWFVPWLRAYQLLIVVDSLPL